MFGLIFGLKEIIWHVWIISGLFYSLFQLQFFYSIECERQIVTIDRKHRFREKKKKKKEWEIAVGHTEKFLVLFWSHLLLLMLIPTTKAPIS
jgi:hypothetical protein